MLSPAKKTTPSDSSLFHLLINPLCMPYLTITSPDKPLLVTDPPLVIDEHNQKAVESIKKLLVDGFKTLLVLGAVGTGKTHLVRSLIPHTVFMDEPTAKQYIVAGDMKLRPPEEYGCSMKFYPLECLARSRTVIYDDLGTADPSAAYIEKTLYWLNERLSEPLRQTVITTNLTLADLATREQRIASRILENAIILELK